MLNYPVKTQEQRAALLEKMRATQQQQRQQAEAGAPAEHQEGGGGGHNEWLGSHLPLRDLVAGGVPVSELHAPLIERNAHRWAIADFNRDGALSEHEFVAFRHPELHNGTVTHLAREILGTTANPSRAALIAAGALVMRLFTRLHYDCATGRGREERCYS